MDSTKDIIGIIAAVLAVGMFLPQSLKVFMTKNVVGLSKATFLMVFTGGIFWTLFGVANYSWQAWGANSFILFLMLPIIFYLFKKLDIDKNNKRSQITFLKSNLTFFTLVFVVLVDFITTLMMLVFKIQIPVPSGLIFSIIGGICTSFPFIPQIVKIFKTKNISSISIISTFSIIVANSFWTAYHTLNVIDRFDEAYLMSVVFSVASILTSLFLVVVFYKYRNIDAKKA